MIFVDFRSIIGRFLSILGQVSVEFKSISVPFLGPNLQDSFVLFQFLWLSYMTISLFGSFTHQITIRNLSTSFCFFYKKRLKERELFRIIYTNFNGDLGIQKNAMWCSSIILSSYCPSLSLVVSLPLLSEKWKYQKLVKEWKIGNWLNTRF